MSGDYVQTEGKYYNIYFIKGQQKHMYVKNFKN